MSSPGWFSRNGDLLAVSVLTLAFGAVSSVGSFVQVQVGRAPMKIEDIKREARQALREAADELHREKQNQATEVRVMVDELRSEKDQFHREVRTEAQRGAGELRDCLRQIGIEIRRSRDEVRRGVREAQRDLGRELRVIRVD
jgi:hypothetical protein